MCTLRFSVHNNKIYLENNFYKLFFTIKYFYIHSKILNILMKIKMKIYIVILLVMDMT